MEIGAIIKKARNEAMITQEQAAEALEVSRQTISNWENSKSYPDIISVIKMSELYSVSLDYLLKEEKSMKQTYMEYLEESTNTVKSKERQAKLMLTAVTLIIWAVSVITFFLLDKSNEAYLYALTAISAVLLVTFFTVSFIIGYRNYIGKLKWIMAFLFSILYSMSGYAYSYTVEESMTYYVTVKWPDITKIPIGLLISIAGLGIGCLLKKKKK